MSLGEGTPIYRYEIHKVYKRYMASSSWMSVKELVKERDRDTCLDCGKTSLKGMVVHHTSYINICRGDSEEVEDCVLLCCSCHNKRHKLGIDGEVPFFASRGYSLGRDNVKSILRKNTLKLEL